MTPKRICVILAALALATPGIASADVRIVVGGARHLSLRVPVVRIHRSTPVYHAPRFSQPPPGWRVGFSASASVSVGFQPVDSGPSCDYLQVYTPPPPPCCGVAVGFAPPMIVQTSPVRREGPTAMGVRILGGMTKEGKAGQGEATDYMGVGMYARYTLTRQVALEAAVEVENRDESAHADNGNRNLRRMDIPTTLGLVLYLSDGKTRPYLTGGVGATFSRADDEFHSERATYRTAYAGIGLSIKVAPRTRVDFDARYTHRQATAQEGETVIDSKLGQLAPLLAREEAATELRAGVTYSF